MKPEKSPPFGEVLALELRHKKTPVVVGLDPQWEMLPAPLRGSDENVSPTTKAMKFKEFCQGIIDVVAPLVPAVKPQVAFFEHLGDVGFRALSDVVGHARARGLAVIVDAKRGDIGSTAQAYASAYFSPLAWCIADALTVNPYMGDDSLAPLLAAARRIRGGLFVLVKTSNAGGKQFQDLVCDGKTVYRHVADYVEQLAMEDAGDCGYGSVGAVVGATYPEQLTELRAAMPHAWLLIPGYGSQGGTAKDVAGGFDDRGLGAIVNNSRGIIFAGRRPEYSRFGESRWQEAAEAATRDMIAALRTETRAGKLAETAPG